jgi:thiamine biosynthesis lipoprotein
MTTTVAAWSDTRRRVMGTDGRVLVHGGPDDLAARAWARLDELEARWSRFLPDSELCRLNRAAGAPVMVSHDTYYVVALAVGSWRSTAGRFDPTILDALEDAGYDRDFDAVATSNGASASPIGPPRPAPGCSGIELLPLVPAVQLPDGVRLDLGGIGKGCAADLVVAELLVAGAAGACVDLGGDIRVGGSGPEPDGTWTVAVDPALAPGRDLRLDTGAVATSTRMKRAWTRGRVARHHLIDPAVGAPAESELRSVTVVAREAAPAEVLAKAAFVAGAEDGPALLADQGVTGLLVHDDGRVEPLPGLEAFTA